MCRNTKTLESGYWPHASRPFRVACTYAIFNRDAQKRFQMTVQINQVAMKGDSSFADYLPTRFRTFRALNRGLYGFNHYIVIPRYIISAGPRGTEIGYLREHYNRIIVRRSLFAYPTVFFLVASKTRNIMNINYCNDSIRVQYLPTL